MFTLVYCNSVPWEVFGFCTHTLCTFEIVFLEIIMQIVTEQLDFSPVQIPTVRSF